MTSQWSALLQNLGVWQGSFTRLSPAGELLEDTPTIVSLEGLNDNQTVRQVVRRLSPPDEKVLEYSSLGRSVLFFDNGAFSQGTIQRAPFAEFGAELGLIQGDRRLRLVQLFNQDGQLDRLTLIREQRAESRAPERPPLTLADLLGCWQGDAQTRYPDWRTPDRYATLLTLSQVSRDRICQQLQIGTSGTGQTLTSQATIDGQRLRFESGSVQVLLLPDGASATGPTQIQPGQPLFLEVGWLLAPDVRQRLIRSYSAQGEWVSLTLVTERRVSAIADSEAK